MVQTFRIAVAGAALAMAVAGSSVQAHEFWLAPEDYTLDPGAQMVVGLRNGELMKGISLPYLPGAFSRFEMVTGDAAARVPGRLGDQPAVTLPAPAAGLTVMLHETTDVTLTYNDFAKFQRFAKHKAATGVLDLHAVRGLPQTGFIESYRRYAKTLIAVGDGAGADRAMGLRIEIVALANPYTDDLTAGLPLLVLLDGQPRTGAQLALFAQGADGTVTETPYTTDAKGVAVVPATPGVTYLADSVDLYALPNDDPAAGPVWHSDWASLTYAVP